MMPYRLWWQNCSYRRDGDTITFLHGLYAENIAKRTVKMLDGAAAGYLLTGNQRMGELAADLMRGMTTIAVDRTDDRLPPADLGSFVTWESFLGPDAECNAQLGAALAGYGYMDDRSNCGSGLAGWDFEMAAGAGNWFNYNIYNYFHIAALSMANMWGCTALARSLMDGLVQRFDTLLTDESLPNGDHDEFSSDSAGWLISAAAEGYPLNAREARHIMDLYGISADWYGTWEYWAPWANLPEGTVFTDFDPPRKTTIPDGEGGEKAFAYMRIVEMPYIFEYCLSPLKAANRVEFIDCDIVADPSRWAQE